MRRSNKEINGISNVLAVLDKCEVMRVGFSDGEKPYIVPMNFGYEMIDDRIYIYFHCATEGRKIDILRKNNNVCFEADCLFELLKGETACKWSAVFESVMGEGIIEELSSVNEKTAGLDVLMKRYGYEGKPHYDEKELEAVTVLRISVTSITGKKRP